MKSKRYWWKAIASFLMVLFTMPLGHALMIMMEHTMGKPPCTIQPLPWGQWVCLW